MVPPPKLQPLPPVKWQDFTPSPIIGVDEVGRGCLAGRVYAAAVILTIGRGRISEYTDSKLLSEKRREELCDDILNHHKAGIGFASVEEIDRLNILQASLLAMRRAIVNLAVKTGHVLVDGNQRIPELPFLQTTLIQGDLRAAPISAASIVAKVTRDRYITALGDTYPQYGFHQHKGYATVEHRLAIQKHGPCIEHRRSFGDLGSLEISTETASKGPLL